MHVRHKNTGAQKKYLGHPGGEENDENKIVMVTQSFL